MNKSKDWGGKEKRRKVLHVHIVDVCKSSASMLKARPSLTLKASVLRFSFQKLSFCNVAQKKKKNKPIKGLRVLRKQVQSLVLAYADRFTEVSSFRLVFGSRFSNGSMQCHGQSRKSAGTRPLYHCIITKTNFIIKSPKK